MLTVGQRRGNQEFPMMQVRKKHREESNLPWWPVAACPTQQLPSAPRLHPCQGFYLSVVRKGNVINPIHPKAGDGTPFLGMELHVIGVWPQAEKPTPLILEEGPHGNIGKFHGATPNRHGQESQRPPT